MLDSYFIDRLASPEPVPGGGAAAPLVGALSAALAEMDAHLTVGKLRYASFEEECTLLLERANKARMSFLDLADRDAQAFLPVSRAYRMPHETEEQRKAKAQALEASLKGAVVPPLETLRLCIDMLEMHKRLAQEGSRLAVSDAGCGAELCRAAARSSYMNVLVNTKFMKERQTADSFNSEASELLKTATRLCDEVFDIVCSTLEYRKSHENN